jgi:hypothetical protein
MFQHKNNNLCTQISNILCPVVHLYNFNFLFLVCVVNPACHSAPPRAFKWNSPHVFNGGSMKADFHCHLIFTLTTVKELDKKCPLFQSKCKGKTIMYYPPHIYCVWMENCLRIGQGKFKFYISRQFNFAVVYFMSWLLTHFTQTLSFSLSGYNYSPMAMKMSQKLVILSCNKVIRL